MGPGQAALRLEVRAAEVRDAVELAPRLRAADARDIAASVGGDPATVLSIGVAHSEPCFAVVEEGIVIGLFGVLPDADAPESGMVWLVGSDALVRSSSRFVRTARHWLAELDRRYAVLWSRVDARNEVHLRWLRRAGFELLAVAERYGVERRPFHEVARRRGSDGQSAQVGDTEPDPTR